MLLTTPHCHPCVSSLLDSWECGTHVKKKWKSFYTYSTLLGITKRGGSREGTPSVSSLRSLLMYVQTSMLEQWFSISFMIRFHQGSNESLYDNLLNKQATIWDFSKKCLDSAKTYVHHHSSIPRIRVIHFEAKWQMLAAQNELLLQINWCLCKFQGSLWAREASSLDRRRMPASKEGEEKATFLRASDDVSWDQMTWILYYKDCLELNFHFMTE